MKNPQWLNDHLLPYKEYDEVPISVFDEINANLDRVLSNEPLVSIVMCAYNEEANVLKTISSLARTKTRYPFEIIVVNNNSNDKTQVILDQLHVRSVFQSVQGWGPARQKGLEAARGKYVLSVDADVIYPVMWVERMIDALNQPGVVCVYGRYSFIAEKGFPRWQLAIYEVMKDIVADLRHFRRPFLNTYGMSMGLLKEPALKIGYVMHMIRGEDGRMAFDLMKYGHIRQVRSRETRVWTYPRTLQKEGTLLRALWNRTVKEFKRLHTMFYPMPDHDTKTSVNEGV